MSDMRINRPWHRDGLEASQKKRRLGTCAYGCVCRRPKHRDHVLYRGCVLGHTASGSQLKWLSVVDEYMREVLALKVDRSITSEDVIDALAGLFAVRGLPKCIRSCNEPEFVAQVICVSSGHRSAIPCRYGQSTTCGGTLSISVP